MARVFEALQQASAADPDYSGRFLQAYDFTHVLELPPGYEPRALPPASAEYMGQEGVYGAFDQEPLPYIDAEAEAETHHDTARNFDDRLVASTAAAASLTGSLPLELRDEFKRLRNAIMLATEAHRSQVLL